MPLVHKDINTVFHRFKKLKTKYVKKKILEKIQIDLLEMKVTMSEMKCSRLRLTAD